MMQKKYGRLSFDERIEIEKLLSHKKSYADIGRALNRSRSTVQRDVTLQGIKQYKAMKGECLAVGKSSNRKSGKNKLQHCESLEKYVLEKLALRWSPRQISISLQRTFPENKAMQISHEAIYLYIYLHSKKELKSLLISELRQKRKYRGNVRRGADKRTTIKDPIRIDERPEEVKGRLIPGHWEGDLVMGKERSSAIGTLVELRGANLDQFQQGLFQATMVGIMGECVHGFPGTRCRGAIVKAGLHISSPGYD